MNIREIQPEDIPAITKMYASAFPSSESADIVELAIQLLSEKVTSFVAEEEGEIAGNIICSPVIVEGNICKANILAPLAVSPAHQHKGIGSQLVRKSMNALEGQGIDVVLVYGNPAYYAKFCFTAENNMFTPPYTLSYPTGWQYKILSTQFTISTQQVSNITCLPPLMQKHLW